MKMRALAIGAGGFIEQAISRDNYPSDALSGNLISDEYRLVWKLQLVLESMPLSKPSALPS